MLTNFSDMTLGQRYYCRYGVEAHRIRHITVNGDRATASFCEYQAPPELVPEFQKTEGTDGHFWYITFFIWRKGATSYWTDKPVSTPYHYVASSKEEWDAILKQITETKKFEVELY